MRELLRRYRDASGKNLRRLSRMGPAELVDRGRQALARRLERVGRFDRLHPRSAYALHGESPADRSAGIGGRVRPQEHPEKDRARLNQFRDSAPARFFEGVASDETTALLETRAPGARAQVIGLAKDIHDGNFALLGYRRLHFGDPVDWHLDPVSGCRAPRVHWSRIDPLDSTVVGDSKVIWELNRHQWLVNLGQAYRYTGDERLGRIFAARVRAWMQANPPGIGINWSSSLEMALRLISWCWALLLFRESKALSPALFLEMLGCMRAQALHIERYLSHYFSPNSHLTGEALGLFYVGAVFPGFAEAARWRALGTRILVEQIERQVSADGVYFEQSTCYQRYTAEFYLHFLILSARLGGSVPVTVAERVKRSLDFLLAVEWPDGSLPQIGDADGGSLLPLVPRAPDDCRGIFAVAAAFFSRPDYAWAAGGVTPELLWLLGPAGVRAFDSLRPAPPATTPSRNFPQGGYVVMRGAWDRNAHQLIFDVGPLGCSVSGGHGHADLLSIQCAAFGAPCVIDPGTYGYADAYWRDYFRSTAAHSTVTVDGMSQAIPDGPFKWRRRPRARLRRWISTDAFDLADADHDAYQCLSDPVLHRRRVLFVKPRYWVVVDDLDATAEHRIDLRFQFGPMDVMLGPDGWVAARRSAHRECRILVSATAPLQADLVAGRQQPTAGWVSPDYGRRVPAPTLTFSTVVRLPLRIVTLIVPMDHPFAAPAVVAATPEHRRIDLVFEHGLETLHISDEDIAIERVPCEATRESSE